MYDPQFTIHGADILFLQNSPKHLAPRTNFQKPSSEVKIPVGFHYSIKPEKQTLA